MDFTQLDQHLNTYLTATNLPGLSLAISDRDRTLHTFTYTSKRHPNPPITSHTLFEIGSIGKSFTSILFQQLVDNEDYDLHKPVTEYLPWFKISSNFAPITTHHLLCHTAGIIRGTDFSGDTIGEVVALQDTQAASPPGTFYRYSNVGYKLLGAILAKVTGQTYPDLVRDRILKPLGLTQTYPDITHDLRSQMAVGYIPLYDDRPTPLNEPIAPGVRYETATADGCIVSNPTDLAQYMRLFMQGGQADVLSAAGYTRMTQPAFQVYEGYDYGYGLFIEQHDDGQFIGHSGGMAAGYVSQMMWHTETGYGFAVMVNAMGVRGGSELITWLKQAIEIDDKRRDLPSLAPPADSFIVSGAEQYQGIYRDGSTILDMRASENRVFLNLNGQDHTLAMQAPDQFSSDHPDFNRSVFTFKRSEDDTIKSVTHGEHLYLTEGVTPSATAYPAEWNAYRGHYRSHNPWLPAFRVLLRAGKLYFQIAGSYEEPLISLGDDVFRIGEDEQLPERLRFDLLIEGQTIRAHFNTAPYYRTFTP
ncbi:MAG: serine hydrolase domain-containing protein [Chloroflexota bacterium]